ncbi:MAG: hypothetical protein O7D35_00310 [Acidobacteria bacterium]|nr:hypothetical protein [Acidobacteriota bacterium]
MKSRWLRVLIVAVFVAVLLFALGPWMVSAWWRHRSANPVRRGVQLARELGCFSCHGDLGRAGIADPGHEEKGVPGWGGGVWMMYVANDEEVKRYILDGSPQDHAPAQTAAHEHAEHMEMPAYRDHVSGTDLDDLVAAFKVLSGMRKPPGGSPARKGYDLSRQWDCFSCHGPAGSGGLPNPGSFTGFVPGWYGADFSEMVQSRAEFDAWIHEGSIARLRDHFMASRYLESQRLSMPAYEQMTPAQLDELWAYTQWLQETDGGYQGEATPW